MPIKASYSDKGDIPEGLESNYKEVDGNFVLQVDGMKTEEDFTRYADALKKRFTDAASDLSKSGNAGVTREELLEIVESSLKKFATGDPNGGKSNGDGGGSPAGDDVSVRLHDLERNVASLTEDNTKLKTERDDALHTSRDTTIRNELSAAAQKAKAMPEGIGNLVTLVQPNFEVTQSGDVVTKLDAKDGVSPNQKPDDFFSAAARDAQYRMFWPNSVGGGADNDGQGGGGNSGDLTKANPWSKAGWNLTSQGKLFRENKVEAERLMTAAGVKLGAIVAVR